MQNIPARCSTTRLDARVVAPSRARSSSCTSACRKSETPHSRIEAPKRWVTEASRCDLNDAEPGNLKRNDAQSGDLKRSSVGGGDLELSDLELSDLELIARCITSQGLSRFQARNCRGAAARRLRRACVELERAGSLRQLLIRHPGLRAASELVRRSLGEELRESDLLNNTHKVEQFLKLWIRDRATECFAVLFLNARFQLISAEEMFRGTINQTAVYPREIVRRALLRNATAVILAHNHPSGAFEASAPDRMLTDATASALNMVDIDLLDHWIVAGSRCLSFAQRGWIPPARR
jgi:DNA repair protein RadC